jgi:cell division protease FtsH
LLIELDGFDKRDGVFLICATNRLDILDPALLRPGRMDKKIYIGLPDEQTRYEIIKIHIKGKPYQDIEINDLVLFTEGLSGAEIESLLNEAMLHALRRDKEDSSHIIKMTMEDIEFIYNKMIAGWQQNKHEMSESMIEQICVHEIGHALISLFCKNHAKMRKVILNPNSPKSPGYTIFENKITTMYKSEELFEHVMVLLSGRIAEEIVYNHSVTTGCADDFQKVLDITEKMIMTYGLGEKRIYTANSDKLKEKIDEEIINIIENAYEKAKKILIKNKGLIIELSKELQKRNSLTYEEMNHFITNYKNYQHNIG